MLRIEAANRKFSNRRNTTLVIDVVVVIVKQTNAEYKCVIIIISGYFSIVLFSWNLFHHKRCTKCILYGKRHL